MLDLKPYHYMIYVSGFFQAGKTSFIHKMDPNATSNEKDCSEIEGLGNTSTTIGFDLGKVVWVRNPDRTYETTLPLKTFEEEQEVYKGWDIKHVHLKGASGLLHFKAVRESIINGANGAVFIIDSSNTTS